jgi:hypothetical protein
MVAEVRDKGREMLLGEYLGGAEIGGLKHPRDPIGGQRGRDQVAGRRCDRRFPAPDIALEKAKHRVRFLKVFDNGVDGA